MDGILGLPTEWQAMLVIVAGAPYLALVTGLLVTYRQVRDWKNLYFASEAKWERTIQAMERGADAMDATRQLVERVLAPIEEHARHEDAG